MICDTSDNWKIYKLFNVIQFHSDWKCIRSLNTYWVMLLPILIMCINSDVIQVYRRKLKYEIWDIEIKKKSWESVKLVKESVEVINSFFKCVKIIFKCQSREIRHLKYFLMLCVVEKFEENIFIETGLAEKVYNFKNLKFG